MAWGRWGRAFAVLGGFGIALTGLTLLLNRAYPPDLTRFEDRSRIVADRAGASLRIFMSGDEKWRLLTRPGDVDPLYLEMLFAFEDKRFRNHAGVDPLAAARAIGQAITTGRIVSGASTLTMQAARLLEPRPRTLTSKFIEAARAIQLEARLTKDEVLALYLTLAPFGGPVEGVRAAALKLFGREPTLLTPAEAALLAAIPQAPNARRPDRQPEAAKAARARVLARATAAGVITADQAATANATPLPSAYRTFPFRSPHLAEELVATPGSGDTISTTIDAARQWQLEQRLQAARADLPAPTTTAAIIVDARTAEVRAIAGGPDYFDRSRAGMIDMTTAVRSPGSALKPFIYGLAFDRLLARPETLIADRPFRDAGYAPTNFSEGYAGDVTVTDALVRSLNIPAVKVLRRLGAARFDAALSTAGVTLEFDRDGGDPGLALALGGVGVDLRTLARAYIALLHEGAMPDRLAFRPGEPVRWRPFIDAEAARDVRRILEMAPPPIGQSAHSGTIAYKTGTSYGFRDALAVGLAGGEVIAVWVGRPDGASCAGCVGISAAAPILFDLAAPSSKSTQPSVRSPARPPPPHLKHFDHVAGALHEANWARIEIRFPVDGSDIRLGASGRAPLIAAGGEGPYRWLADGAPVGLSAPGGTLLWRPTGGGFHEILVLDRTGASAEARVYVGGAR